VERLRNIDFKLEKKLWINQKYNKPKTLIKFDSVAN
jgi:hypothetical protein